MRYPELSNPWRCQLERCTTAHEHAIFAWERLPNVRNTGLAYPPDDYIARWPTDLKCSGQDCAYHTSSSCFRVVFNDPPRVGSEGGGGELKIYFIVQTVNLEIILKAKMFYTAYQTFENTPKLFKPYFMACTTVGKYAKYFDMNSIGKQTHMYKHYTLQACDKSKNTSIKAKNTSTFCFCVWLSV